MVFGLFSRKRDSTTESQSEAVPAQLRTPSPSVVDKQSSPVREPPATPSPPPEPRSPGELRTFIQSIPPQTFHEYTLSQLHPSNSVDPETLAHLSAFFSQLAPPPQIHCVRCHKSFFEIENTDRSCLVAHDDESAEVERVSSKAKGKGTLYETLWGCCGKTVEGDGDMGPPDGWCYEGKHTTDTKRARFRADSSMHDDKLISCERLRCGMPKRSSRTTRKRGRAVDDEGEEDEGEQSSTPSSHPSTTTSPQSSNGRKKPRTRAPPAPLDLQPEAVPEPASNQMDVDTPSVPTPSSPKPKPKSRAKPKAAAPKAASTPKTSSPLVLAPPFVSRSSSPERPNRAQVVITSSSRPGMQPPASPGRSRKDSSSSTKATSSPERSRKDSTTSTKSRMKGKGKAKVLSDVVDSSVDAERAPGWTPGA
ncbi:hypothetical protein H0H87_010729 [Tephrocybe sp. NHM501043]|nr:hypothetical protein H0H87_010729 [Tephrocybe sp. NHM501043]